MSDPAAEGMTITVTEVTQDEPTLGTGGGDMSPDAVIQSPGSPVLPVTAPESPSMT